jgi:hypothetical protein
VTPAYQQAKVIGRDLCENAGTLEAEPQGRKEHVAALQTPADLKLLEILDK